MASVSELANEVKPKMAATTPAGLRIGGAALPFIQQTMVDKIFERTEAEGRELTLEEVLLLSDVEDVLFELKNGNERLVNFLNEEEILEQLLDYVSNFNQAFSPNALRAKAVTQDEKELVELRIQCIHTSCEILALEGTEASIFTEENIERILHFLFSFVAKEDDTLEFDDERNGVLPSQVSAILQVFIVNNPENVIDYLIEREPKNFVKSFAEGLHQSEVSNLLLSILWLLSPSPAKVKSDGPPSEMRVLAAESFNQWLASGEFVPTIIQVLADPQAPEASGLAGEVLQELIALAGRHVTKGIDTPLIFQQFAAEKSLAVLVPCILELKDPNAFSAGVAVILELLKYEAMAQKKGPSREPSPLWKLIEKDLDKVIDKLKIREPKEKFGFVRLRVLGFCGRLVAQSANPQNIGFIHAMTKLNFWSVILDLFFTFVWNNFVHNVVERILAVALTNPLLREFKLTLLRDLKLVDRLVEGASRTDVGYAGALATVATTIIKSSAGDPQVSQYLDGHEAWQAFVKGPLSVIRTTLETRESTFPPPKDQSEPGSGGGRGRGRGQPPAPGGSGGRGAPMPGATNGLGRGRGSTIQPSGPSAPGGAPSVVAGGRGRGTGRGGPI